MYLLWKGTLLLIFGCYLILFVAGDCIYKDCDCFETDIYCSGVGFQSVPICQSTNCTGYLSLYLDSNNITDISAGTLYTGLTELSLNYNPISAVDDNAFDDISTTLQSLSFSYARLSRIPDAFLHLNSLRRLDVSYTNISDWNVDVIVHIGRTLQILRLENVGFTTWPDWISHCEHLIELDLSNNVISSIPDTAFNKLFNSLQILTLSHNNFTATPKSLFNLKNLTSLDMQYNKISNITWLPESKTLSTLTLNNNHIYNASYLSNVLRPFSDSLNSLSLSFNRLSAIPDLSFLTKLGAYDFSYNQISDSNSGAGSESVSSADFSHNLLQSIPVIYKSLKSVTIMFLPYNRIHRFQDTDIPHWVINLDLEYNLITEITDTSFPVNSSLLFLTLDNNPIVSMSSLAFKNLQSLSSLTMEGTKLTRLPLTLAHLTSISYISLNYNPELVCTCLEKGVGNIAPYVDRDGMCGVISIYNFLVELSSGCP